MKKKMQKGCKKREQRLGRSREAEKRNENEKIKQNESVSILLGTREKAEAQTHLQIPKVNFLPNQSLQ